MAGVVWVEFTSIAFLTFLSLIFIPLVWFGILIFFSCLFHFRPPFPVLFHLRLFMALPHFSFSLFPVFSIFPFFLLCQVSLVVSVFFFLSSFPFSFLCFLLSSFLPYHVSLVLVVSFFPFFSHILGCLIIHIGVTSQVGALLYCTMTHGETGRQIQSLLTH